MPQWIYYAALILAFTFCVFILVVHYVRRKDLWESFTGKSFFENIDLKETVQYFFKKVKETRNNRGQRVKFYRVEKSTTLEQIAAVEKIVGLKFPEEYINHLMKFNGGRCKPNVFHFNERGMPESDVVEWFLAVYDGESDNLIGDIEILKLDEKRMPSYMIPIAHDPFGNAICLSCGEQDYGYIYFWDHELESGEIDLEDSKFENLSYISDSLGSFLDSLTDE